MNSYRVLSLAEAQQLIQHVQTAVEAQHKGAAIAVVDNHGELMAFARTDGCPFPSIQIAINKAYTAARERNSSRNLGEASRRDGFPLTNFGELRYVGWGGGFPIWHEGAIVGAIGVSGLPEQEDMDLAQNAIRAVFG
jgi:glc operon protein GlcG